ncbi:low affinity Fe/Cu permease [Rhizobium tibeticum]|uniref:Low affinity Fe/Cu permease n=1 Tax=Rhizobium tibeticum TaxID=501024 RepID=A0A1H8LWQ2_9HYPH|nr:low affinity iron permease family protein [Rhizobium tibeticum]MDP9808962.1 low affinity Fe/Cu permease [Rhizobium tibeticum]SEH88435.1 putative small integral membrane protein [Rhizobium tibeticum]SEO09450.1 Low affinity Fe/Cu permease [Rhizobium tibeticum]
MATPQHLFTRFASKTSEWAGRPVTFVLAVVLVAVWAATGPLFDFSETWQLVINTGTTIITFLMVFVLQNAQTRDARAVQAKLDEIILTSHAENRFIGIEHLDDEDLKHLDRLVAKAAKGVREGRTNGTPKATSSSHEANEKRTSAKPRKPKRKTAPSKTPSR